MNYEPKSYHNRHDNDRADTQGHSDCFQHTLAYSQAQIACKILLYYRLFFQ